MGPKYNFFLEKYLGGRGGSFLIPKKISQIFLYSKRFILVLNFGKIVQFNNFIANLRKLPHAYKKEKQ